MGYAAFVAAVVAVGILGSFVPGGEAHGTTERPDYHIIPYAGDVFGA